MRETVRTRGTLAPDRLSWVVQRDAIELNQRLLDAQHALTLARDQADKAALWIRQMCDLMRV